MTTLAQDFATLRSVIARLEAHLQPVDESGTPEPVFRTTRTSPQPSNACGPLIHVAALIFEGVVDSVITATTADALEAAVDAAFAELASEEGEENEPRLRDEWTIDRMQTPLHGTAS